MRLTLAVMAASMLFCSPLWAQTGVSDDRLSLPEGPGSLEGLGENVDIDPNMGAMRHGVTLKAPAGFPAVTPGLSLSYNSGAGSSVVGVGWNLAVGNIERMTYRKLPRYDASDDFAAGGGDQLVRLPNTDPAIYRSRFEKGFMRYTWMDEGDGSEGYWLCESPDGTRMYYGARADGTLVPNARVTGPDGTFRYMLVETVDVFDHRMVHSYIKDGFVSLLSHIGYVYADGQNPTYEVRLAYGERADDSGAEFLSDGKPGFNELLTMRLETVTMLSRGRAIRRYELTYDNYADAGGFTRLAKVETYGSQGGLFPVAHGFTYSNALGGLCDNDDCDRPSVHSMGTVGVSLRNGSATLIDINGDALPDLLDTSQDGPHRFFLNVPDREGQSRFALDPVTSAVGTRTSHDLSAPRVQVLDADGDGFTDLVNAGTGRVLRNLGGTDWEANMDAGDTTALSSVLGDDGQFQNLRFLDYNGDKLIDVVRSDQQNTTVYRNEGDGFVVDEDVENIGAGFQEDGLQFADMNGDGLLDVVRVQPRTLRYRLNYGWGAWGPWEVVEDLPIPEFREDLVELEDINGDGLADMVLVFGTSVTYALNRNGASFGEAVVLLSEDVDGDLPNRGDETTVLYADMNGNGSSDIVWFGALGAATYLELFPVRPNLLTKITNGIGKISEVNYTSTVVLMARDGGSDSWRYRLPFPNLVVTSVAEYDELNTENPEVTTYAYRHGFYDGIEKQFRGFEEVELSGSEDDFQEAGHVALAYEIGAQDVYRHSLLTRTVVTSGGRLLTETETDYADCQVAQIPDGTELPVRFICPTEVKQVIQEGQSESMWVRTRETMAYDGYGNVSEMVNHGVVSIGGQACAPCDRPDSEFGAPCGPDCVGDETYTETSYVSPENTGGRWILHAASLVETYGRPGSELRTQTRSFYDGEAFVGLAAGRLTQGKVSRVTHKVDVGDDRVIESTRLGYDEHGNVTESLDALGVPGGTTHRTTKTYDAENLRVASMTKYNERADGTPYTLTRVHTYEPLFDRLASGTHWMTDDGVTQSEPRPTVYLYDEFGRLLQKLDPGQDPNAPTETYEFDLQSPVSRIIARRRSTETGPLDVVSVSCIDGRGRTLQSRTRVDDGRWIVGGYTRFNTQSKPLEQHQPYEGTSGECDTQAPEGVGFLRFRYDASFRPIRTVYPDAAIYGDASSTRTEYLPLAERIHDTEDNDDASPHADTYVIRRRNGLGKVTSIERVLVAGQPPHITQVHYDELGRTIGYTDPESNRKSQTYDLVDRITSVTDPNTGGELVFEYDDAGNTLRAMDPRGVVTAAQFDGLNRKTSEWDEADPEGTRITHTFDIPTTCDPTVCTHTAFQIAEVSYPGLRGARGTETYGYDVRGRVTHSSRSLGDFVFETASEYDNADRTTAVTYPDGNVVERQYDANGRPVAIPGVLDSISYDSRGQMTRVEYAHGAICEWSYDDLMRLESQVLTDGADVLQGVTFTRDRVGHIVEVEDLGGSLSGIPDFGAQYRYDAWYRLVEASLNTGGDDRETLSFTHDVLNNLEERASSLGDLSPVNTGAHEYLVARPNAVSRVSGVEMDYDLAGNMTVRGERELTWDFMGRLSSVTGSSSPAENHYGSGRGRVATTHDGSTSIYVSPEFIVRDGISELYVAMDTKRLARIESDVLATQVLTDLAVSGAEPDGQINAGDAWLSAASEAGTVAVDEVSPSAASGLLHSSLRRLLLETGPADGTTYLHHDHLKSITLTSVAAGDGVKVVGQRRFYPFGVVRAETGENDPFGFTGMETDEATGLVYFTNRYYDPWLSRWASIDPLYTTISEDGIRSQGTVAYAYVSGDPINSIDADGLDRVALFIGAEAPHVDPDSGAHDGYLSDAHEHYTHDPNYTQIGLSAAAPGGFFGGANLANNGSILTVVGHTDGPSSKFGWTAALLTPKQLVSRLEAEGLTPAGARGLTIELQGCTTAVRGTGAFGGQKPSFAAEFAKRLAKRGFSDVTVVGYHGFVKADRSIGTTWKYTDAPDDHGGVMRYSEDTDQDMDHRSHRSEYRTRTVTRGPLPSKVKSEKVRGPTSRQVPETETKDGVTTTELNVKVDH